MMTSFARVRMMAAWIGLAWLPSQYAMACDFDGGPELGVVQTFAPSEDSKVVEYQIGSDHFIVEQSSSCCMSGVYTSTDFSIYHRLGKEVRPVFWAKGIGQADIKIKDAKLYVTCSQGSRFENDTSYSEKQFEWQDNEFQLAKQRRWYASDEKRAEHKKAIKAGDFTGYVATGAYLIEVALGHHLTGKLPALEVFLELAAHQVVRSDKLLKAGKTKQAKDEMLQIAKLEPLDLIQMSPASFADIFSVGKKPQSLFRVFNDIGYIFEQAGEAKQALPYLEWVQAKNPERTVVYLNLFDVYTKLDQPPKARASGLRYIEMMTANQQAKLIPKRVWVATSQD